jgi:hypothetical protein
MNSSLINKANKDDKNWEYILIVVRKLPKSGYYQI